MARVIFWVSLALTPITLVAHYAFGVAGTPSFVLSAGALAPLAFLIGEATENVAEHTGPGIGGFLNASDPKFNFAEVYPDEGDMDFVAIMRILRDSQFSHAILPDHMPAHPDDPGKLQAYAFGYGYIHALIQAVNSEV